MSIPSPEVEDAIKKRAALTQELLRYPQTYGGWGNFLGGVVFIAVTLINLFVSPGLLVTILTWSLTITWLAGKEVIRAIRYRPLDKKKKLWAKGMREWHIALVVCLALIAVFGWSLGFLSQAFLSEELGAILFFTVLPIIVALFCRTPIEFGATLFLLTACVTASKGQETSFFQQSDSTFAFMGLLLLILGILEDRNFGWLSQKWKEKIHANW